MPMDDRHSKTVLGFAVELSAANAAVEVDDRA
jgi:hypothetical protein